MLGLAALVYVLVSAHSTPSANGKHMPGMHTGGCGIEEGLVKHFSKNAALSQSNRISTRID